MVDKGAGVDAEMDKSEQVWRTTCTLIFRNFYI